MTRAHHPPTTIDVDPRWADAYETVKDLPPEERERIYARDFADQPKLVKQLEDWIAGDAAHVPVDGTLEPGSLIDGKYRVERLLGAGGLGDVYLATQLHRVQRSVAVKALRPGKGWRFPQERFDAERNALSRLKHPFVAGIYDAGVTVEGRHYIVMEVVDGVALTEYCATHDLDLAARLRLFIDVCRGVHHAHQRGVIHRDIKPSNILVEAITSGPVPKVIDFGLALERDAPPEAPGEASGLVAGTPAYMSPEQAGVGDGVVDATSDIFSLGAVLYELLTGVTPLGDKQLPTDEVEELRRAIMAHTPMTPSQRAISLAHAPLPTSLPAVSPEALRGDLDAIVMKALSKASADRYPSASELAADVQRVLDHDPVQARHQTAWYRFAKLWRRHRVRATFITVLLLTVIVSSAVVIELARDRAVQVRVAAAAEAMAETERAAAREAQAMAERLVARSHLAAAKISLEVGDAVATMRSLDAVPVSHRGWEHDHLRWLADRSDLTLVGHDSEILALAVSTDDRWLASADAAGRVILWELATGRRLRSLDAHANPVRAMAFAGDPPLLVTSDLIADLRAWDLTSGELRWSVPGRVSVTEAGAHPHAAELAVGVDGEGAIAVLDAASGARLRAIPVEVRWPSRPSFSADGRVLHFTDMARIFAIDAATGAIAWTLGGHLVGFDPGRERFMVRPGPQHTGWSVHRVADGGFIEPVVGQTNHAERVALGAHGTIAAGERSGVITLGHAHHGPGERRVELPGLRVLPTAMTFDHAGERLIVGDAAGNLRVWPAGLDASPYAAPRGADVVFTAAVSPTGDAIVSAGWGGVTRYDPTTGMVRWFVVVSRAYLGALAFSLDGQRVAVGDRRGALWVLDGDGRVVLETRAGDAGVVSIAWIDPTHLAVGLTAGEVAMVDVTTGEVVALATDLGAPVMSLAVSPARDLLAVGTGGAEGLHPADGDVEPRPPDTRAQVLLLDLPALASRHLLGEPADAVRALAFSPDGARLASGSLDGAIGISSVVAREATNLLHGVGSGTLGAAFSPDGRRLVTAHGGGTLVVWDAETMEHLLTLRGPRQDLLAVAFSPDGRRVLASGRDMPVVAFETGAPPGGESARALASRALRRVATLAEDDSLGADLEAALSAALPPGPERAAALAAVAARGQHPNFLNSSAWEVVRYPGRSRVDLEQALRRVELAWASFPVWHFANTLALARLRLGDHLGAVEAARESLAAGHAGGSSPYPGDYAVLALAALALGDVEAAAEARREGATLLESGRWPIDPELVSIFREVERAWSRHVLSE